jgi:hypothetical protein
MVKSTSVRRTFLAIAALLAWGALALQFYLSVSLAHGNGQSTAAALSTFLGYFTILTNLLAATALTCALFDTEAGEFRTVSFSSAVTVYIAIVGSTYFLLLRNTWSPQGLAFLADVLLHYVTPTVFVLYWFFFVPKGRLKWSAPLIWWPLYPLAYVLMMLVRGAATGFYPYHFLNASQLGYERVAINAVGFTAVFLGGGLLLVQIDRWLART